MHNARMLVFATVCFGCSSSSISATPTDAGTTDADIVVADAGGDAGAPSGTGFFGVYLNQLGAGYGVVVNAYTGGPGDRCYPQQVEGGCTLIDCRTKQDPIAFASAGQLTLSSDNGPITLKPSADKSYPLASNSSRIAWKPGETVTLAAVGGVDVSMFNVTVIEPAVVTPIGPLLEAGTALDVPRDQPFTVSWTTSADSVEIEIFIEDPLAPLTDSTSLICTATGAAGTFSVPVAALARLPATDMTTPSSYTVAGAKSTTTTVGAATVLFDARNFAAGVPITLK
jgi:hypothetical protein